jgi:hypothetical protein
VGPTMTWIVSSMRSRIVPYESNSRLDYKLDSWSDYEGRIWILIVP